jgi:hypothetical protein
VAEHKLGSVRTATRCDVAQRDAMQHEVLQHSRTCCNAVHRVVGWQAQQPSHAAPPPAWGVRCLSPDWMRRAARCRYRVPSALHSLVPYRTSVACCRLTPRQEYRRVKLLLRSSPLADDLAAMQAAPIHPPPPATLRL